MKILLDKIVEECKNREIKVSTVSRGGKIMHKVMGFSKSRSALLYVKDGAVVCETMGSKKDHVMTFRDLSIVAMYWHHKCSGTPCFEAPESEWESVFKEFFYIIDNKITTDTIYSIAPNDLPF